MVSILEKLEELDIMLINCKSLNDVDYAPICKHISNIKEEIRKYK